MMVAARAWMEPGLWNLTERVGFEPTDRNNDHSISSRAHSTTLASLRVLLRPHFIRVWGKHILQVMDHTFLRADKLSEFRYILAFII